MEAAELLSVRQPDVSKMLRGEFRQFSVERLLRFLVALDQDVEIVVKPHRRRSEGAALQGGLKRVEVTARVPLKKTLIQASSGQKRLPAPLGSIGLHFWISTLGISPLGR